jgi:hypothetical protein
MAAKDTGVIMDCFVILLKNKEKTKNVASWVFSRSTPET